MTSRCPVRIRLALAALVLLAGLPASASASTERLPGAHISAARIVPAANYPGMQRLSYLYGPIRIAPGQNTIEAQPNDQRPQVPGFITRFKPDLVYAKVNARGGHDVPRVDVLHLHHGVWLNNLYPTFAAGEEKTIISFPQGFGYHYDPSDSWVMNYMIHNLTPNRDSVYIKYDIDFVPDAEPAAAGLTPVHPLWLDVAGLKPYPVFDAIKGQGTKGVFTFPDQAKGAQKKNIGRAHEWTAPQDVTLVGTAGHLHPGGLYNDLTATRAGATTRLFRSEAKYFEPAGAVSWDVATTATKPEWRVAVRAGDRLNVHVAYDTSKASWYESMGIMVAWYADGITADAQDPFARAVDSRGWITHGHLAENNNHGGGAAILDDARKLVDGTAPTNVDIKGYIYGRGDLNMTGARQRPPVVRVGNALKFTNRDATATMTPQASAYHTITACRAPCNRATGIAYPLADAAVPFDSGELGYGPSLGSDRFTPAANRNTWKTPKTLKAGTYTYFCRIHPFMRGAFRVVGKSANKTTTR